MTKQYLAVIKKATAGCAAVIKGGPVCAGTTPTLPGGHYCNHPPLPRLFTEPLAGYLKLLYKRTLGAEGGMSVRGQLSTSRYVSCVEVMSWSAETGVSRRWQKLLEKWT